MQIEELEQTIKTAKKQIEQIKKGQNKDWRDAIIEFIGHGNKTEKKYYETSKVSTLTFRRNISNGEKTRTLIKALAKAYAYFWYGSDESDSYLKIRIEDDKKITYRFMKDMFDEC